ncbi:hypothetical protein A6J42_20760 [Leptospira interrogans serovar Copenhageni]|uniref:Uncharacterized protein n=2 Tax=Leptospira interrogans TaxID=173 RepID=A0AAQ0AYY5_LEPIR|nr:hypothetical protein A6J42_20760 [Leptospira interrogans serovar Copenhageni]MBE0305372.1 hypothetical protein [Leptospira interrogans serovar Yeoncheon]QOI34703.1 hypothetical protein LeptoLang_11060 [Leptospira interrogans serovar Icterohaemorrhagiae]QOI42865.1 hypothetical protein Lepto782_11720 [Leptospira interrogans serovar Canicola]QOI50472.1 hypothetical protein Lepto1489_08515 [Leptospira interrogans serovar Bataviae]
MNTTDSSVINFYFINCGSSHILKNRSCKIQIPTFFRIMSFLRQTYVSLVDYFSVEKLNF